MRESKAMKNADKPANASSIQVILTRNKEEVARAILDRFEWWTTLD